MGPIPNSKIADYAERRGLDPDMVAVFEYVLDYLDNVYLNDQLSKQKAQSARDEREASRNSGKTKTR